MKKNTVDIHNKTDLEAWLVKNGIPLERWGVNNAKSIDNLFNEIKKGECVLQEQPIMRVLPVVQVIIKNGDLILVELEQEFLDQRTRKRCMPPSEKMKPGENWHTAAIRCMEEELGLLPDQFTVISTSCKPVVFERLSKSYPGLSSQYHIYKVNIHTDQLPTDKFWTDEKEEPEQKQIIHRHQWGWVTVEQINTF